MPHISAINDILASVLPEYVPHFLCWWISPTGCQQNCWEMNTSMHISHFLLLAFYYPPRSHCRASTVAAFSYLDVVITLWYTACAKENAKQLPKLLASNGAWKCLSLELGYLQWCDGRPSALPDILVPEYCYNPQWRIKQGSDLVQREGFNTTGSPGVIVITAYAAPERKFFPFWLLLALLYLHARDHLVPKTLILHQKRTLIQCTSHFRCAPIWTSVNIIFTFATLIHWFVVSSSHSAMMCFLFLSSIPGRIIFSRQIFFL